MQWLLWITLAWGAVSETEWQSLVGQTVRLESTTGMQLEGEILSLTQDTVRIQRSRDGRVVEVRKDEVSTALNLSAPPPAPEPALEAAPEAAPQPEAQVQPAPQAEPEPVPDPEAAPHETSTAPGPPGVASGTQTQPMPAPPAAKPAPPAPQEPKVNSEMLYRDGYTAGQLQAAAERNTGPLVISGCLVGGATAVGCMSPLPSLGCLLGAGTLALAPGYYGLAWPLLEEPKMVAVPTEDPAPYAVGYAQGYLAEAGKRRAQAAMVGGATGLLVGALVGVTVANSAGL